jgi:hypothetical protein
MWLATPAHRQRIASESPANIARTVSSAMKTFPAERCQTSGGSSEILHSTRTIGRDLRKVWK